MLSFSRRARAENKACFVSMKTTTVDFPWRRWGDGSRGGGVEAVVPGGTNGMLMNVSVDEREEAPLRRIIGYMGSIIKTADSGGGWGVGGDGG